MLCKFIEVRAELIVMIDSETVKRTDTEAFLQGGVEDTRKKQEELATSVEERFNATYESMALESKEVRKKIEKVEDSHNSLKTRAEDGIEQVKVARTANLRNCTPRQLMRSILSMSTRRLLR